MAGQDTRIRTVHRTVAAHPGQPQRRPEARLRDHAATSRRGPVGRWAPGTLYAALARLEEAGLVEPLDAGRPSPAVPADRGRRDRRSPSSSAGSSAFARAGAPPARRARAMRSLLIRCYPARWRDRYGDEFEAILDERPLGPFDVADILLGALDARLRHARPACRPPRRKGFRHVAPHRRHRRHPRRRVARRQRRPGDRARRRTWIQPCRRRPVPRRCGPAARRPAGLSAFQARVAPGHVLGGLRGRRRSGMLVCSRRRSSGLHLDYEGCLGRVHPRGLQRPRRFGAVRRSRPIAPLPFRAARRCVVGVGVDPDVRRLVSPATTFRRPADLDHDRRLPASAGSPSGVDAIRLDRPAIEARPA